MAGHVHQFCNLLKPVVAMAQPQQAMRLPPAVVTKVNEIMDSQKPINTQVDQILDVFSKTKACLVATRGKPNTNGRLPWMWLPHSLPIFQCRLREMQERKMFSVVFGNLVWESCLVPYHETSLSI